jgi:hypothetical protein
MPISITQIIKKANLTINGKVDWGERPKTEEQGVYIVSMSEDPNKIVNPYKEAPIDIVKIEEWLKLCKSLTLNGKRPTSKDLADRISKYWFSDETILYIGKAPRRNSGTGISCRVCEYYCTLLGYRRPHRGGCWIKTLNILKDLKIYYSFSDEPGKSEDLLIDIFASQVTSNLKSFDQQHPYPFANLMHQGSIYKGKKQHSIKNAAI